jgi:hypothetical protein
MTLAELAEKGADADVFAPEQQRSRGLGPKMCCRAKRQPLKAGFLAE